MGCQIVLHQTWHNIKFLFNININIFRNFVFKININIKILQTISSISKSISISKFSHPQYQNQYQNFSKPRINIKIDINIVKILILKIKIFCGLKICFFTCSDLCHMGPMGYHLIPIAPKHGTLGPSLGTKGPIQRPMLSHLWTSLAQNDYWANSMKPWDPTRNLLHCISTIT